ncbi:hypothetical protein PHOSAC3_150035 [Mesotoga infera]|nr:hypothetical protein PHOSAC3_150035 [Mesotoga infera]
MAFAYAEQPTNNPNFLDTTKYFFLNTLLESFTGGPGSLENGDGKMTAYTAQFIHCRKRS